MRSKTGYHRVDEWELSPSVRLSHLSVLGMTIGRTGLESGGSLLKLPILVVFHKADVTPLFNNFDSNSSIQNWTLG